MDLMGYWAGSGNKIIGFGDLEYGAVKDPTLIHEELAASRGGKSLAPLMALCHVRHAPGVRNVLRPRIMGDWSQQLCHCGGGASL